MSDGPSTRSTILCQLSLDYSIILMENIWIVSKAVKKSRQSIQAQGIIVGELLSWCLPGELNFIPSFMKSDGVAKLIIERDQSVAGIPNDSSSQNDFMISSSGCWASGTCRVTCSECVMRL